MGDPLGRVPGPTGGDVTFPIKKLLGFLTNLTATVDCKESAESADSADSKDSTVQVSHIKSEVLDVMRRIYYPGGGGGDPLPGEASIRDPTPAVLPLFREGDSRRDVKTPGTRLISKCFKMKLDDIRLSRDQNAIDLFADGRATLDIPTTFPSTFDTPTDIPIRLTLIELGAKDVSLSGYAKAYQFVRARYKLTLHFDRSLLLRKLVQLAKDRDVHQADVEEMLSNMSFDFSSLIKAGPIPLTFIKMAASSALPLKHPLIGSTDDLIPVQAAALPDHELFMGGLLLVPKGVFFGFNAPGLGAHYSRYGTKRGFSITGAGLAVPNLSDFTHPNLFAYFDASYSKRVTDSLDLSVGLTYTFSPTAASGQPDSLQLQYLQAESKSWLPPSEDNLVPDQNLSGHNVMVTVKGKFDWL